MFSAKLRSVWTALVLLLWPSPSLSQTWCNKNYMKNQPVVPPGGQFPMPERSSSALLALRCSQAIRPYLPGDAGSSDVAILIDAYVTFSGIHNAETVTLPTNAASTQQELGTLNVTVSADGQELASGIVPVNATKHPLVFSLSKLKPRKEAYTLSCRASLGPDTFQATGKLTYLPAPPAEIGSVTKMDLRTGALLARPSSGDYMGPFQPILPIGFYTAFDGYLADNLTLLGELKDQGFNVIHPIPTFGNLTALDAVLDEMQRVGLYLMYDMRWTYMNASEVAKEVDHIKRRPNLLLWYTADEPDGTSDPLDATVKCSNLITSLDGGDGRGGSGYHPVSLVLNCQDYEWNAYANGTDIVMQDAYPIGNNVTFSSEWGTACTPDYGCCGCDNCKGSLEDISDRMDEYRQRLFINGWERTKAIWTVPQGFGNSSYWKRHPTGKEFVVQSVLGLNHGALGIVSWSDPTTLDIKHSASALALSLPNITPFLLNPTASFHQTTINHIDVGLWTVNASTLVLATNMNYQAASLKVVDLGIPAGFFSVRQVFDSGAKIRSGSESLEFEPVGSGAFIFRTELPQRVDHNNDTNALGIIIEDLLLLTPFLLPGLIFR